MHLARSRSAALNSHARAQAIQTFLVRLPTYLYQIGLFHARRSLGEFVCQVAIVCYQQQPLAQVVQAAHRVEPLAHLVKELHDRWPALWIAHRGDEALWLIHHKVAQALGSLQQLSIDPNVIPAWVCLGSECRDYRAIHLNAPLRDQLFGMAPAGDSGLREDLLKALQLCRRLRRFGFNLFVGPYGLCLDLLRSLDCGLVQSVVRG